MQQQTDRPADKKCQGCTISCETFVIPGRKADTKIHICQKGTMK